MPPVIFDPRILYEDNHILVVAKPPGMPSQGGRSAVPDLVGWLKRDLALRHGKPGEAFLGLVHRLDQPVSGLMVFAKTSKAASRLSLAFRDRKVSKLYLAIVMGEPPADRGEFCDKLSRREVGGKVRLSDEADAYEARLGWQVLSRSGEGEEALLLVDLMTGRRHQIRVQLSGHGLPILGDRRYGLLDSRDQAVPTIALHACGLTFPHPVRPEIMSFRLAPAINPSFSAEDSLAFDAHFSAPGEQDL